MQLCTLQHGCPRFVPSIIAAWNEPDQFSIDDRECHNYLKLTKIIKSITWQELLTNFTGVHLLQLSFINDLLITELHDLLHSLIIITNTKQDKQSIILS